MAIEILDRIATFGLLIDRLMELGKKASAVVPDVVKKKVARKLGATTAEAVKSFDDEEEYLRAILIKTLGKEDAERALRFEEELRRKTPKLAEAYVLALAKLARQTEESDKDSGYSLVVQLIQLLLRRNTFEKRVAFIKGRGIEALVSPPEADLLATLGKYYPELRRNIKKGAGKLQKRLEKDPYRGFWIEAFGFNPKCLVPRRVRNFF